MFCGFACAYVRTLRRTSSHVRVVSVAGGRVLNCYCHLGIRLFCETGGCVLPFALLASAWIINNGYPPHHVNLLVNTRTLHAATCCTVTACVCVCATSQGNNTHLYVSYSNQSCVRNTRHIQRNHASALSMVDYLHHIVCFQVHERL